MKTITTDTLWNRNRNMEVEEPAISRNIATIQPLRTEAQQTYTEPQEITQQPLMNAYGPLISYTNTMPIYQILGTAERDTRIFYLKQRYMAPLQTDMLYHCSFCMSTATPLSLLTDNWTTYSISSFGRTILGFKQPANTPDMESRIKARELTETPEMMDVVAADRLKAPFVTFLILMGELTFSVMTTTIGSDTDIAQCIMPPVVLVEVANFVRNMRLNIEVLQLSIYQAKPDQGTILLPFNNNFVSNQSKIKGKICHRFIIPTVITEWIDYTRSPLRSHYISP